MKRKLSTILSILLLASCTAPEEKAVTSAFEVILSSETLSLDEGQSQTLEASVLPASLSQNVIWSVLDDTVATVSEDGTVTALKAGITYVIATSEDGVAIASCLIDVRGEHSFEDPLGNVVYLATPQDLVALAENETATHVFLTDDIDMTGVDYNSDEFSFKGVFEGNGKSITGLTVPLFNNLRGSVRNLNISSDIVYVSGGNEYGIGILAHYAYVPDDATSVPVIDGVTVSGSLTVDLTTTLDNYNIGGLTGASNGVMFRNCTNNATISLGENFSAKNVRVGGITGIAQTAATADIVSCTNNGDITLDASALSGDLFVGGVLGNASQAVDIKECENTGDVSVSGEVVNLRLAGVIAQASVNVALSSSSNSGALTLSGCHVGKQFYMGGIMAEITNETENTYENLVNTGLITVQDITTVGENASFAYIAGIVGCSDGTGKTFRNCTHTADINARVDGTPVIPFKCRIGGVAGIINRNPEGCRSEGDIRFKGSVSGCHIGGIAGYLNIAEYADITYKGTIWTNGTSGTNYTGGLVGNVNSTVNDANVKVFRNCSLSASVHGANSSTGVAGLFCNSQASVSYEFTGCTVGSGSVRKSSNDGTKDDVITSADQLTGSVLIGGKGSAGCKVTGCTVVAPDEI